MIIPNKEKEQLQIYYLQFRDFSIIRLIDNRDDLMIENS